jgi:YfiR/HmsC-like
MGNFLFGTSLAELTRKATVNGHRVEVKWIRKEQDLPGCQLIFVGRSEAKHYDKVLEAVKNSISLAVGEIRIF